MTENDSWYKKKQKKKTPTVNNFGKCRHDVYIGLGLRNNDLNHSMLKHPASILYLLYAWHDDSCGMFTGFLPILYKRSIL